MSDCELALAFFSSGKLIQIVAGFQIGAERASRWFQDSGDDRNVQPLGFSLLELFLQCPEDRWRFRKYQQPADSTIESMNHERFTLVTGMLQIVRNATDQGIALAMIGGDGKHIRRFVDDDNVLVFIDD